MPDNEMYRSAALEQLSTPERLDQYVSVADTRGWLGAIAALVALGALAAWGVAGTITTTVTAHGIVRPAGGTTGVVSPVAGVLANAAATNDSVVPRGAVIASIDVAGVAPGTATRVDVRTTRDGRVMEVLPRAGDWVRAGDRIAVLAGTADSLDALVYVPAAMAGRVRPAMEVDMLAPGAARAAGGVKGRVVDVGLAPVSRDAMAAALGSDVLADDLATRGPVVAIRVALPRTRELRSGAVTDASIVIQRRRPISFLRPGSTAVDRDR